MAVTRKLKPGERWRRKLDGSIFRVMGMCENWVMVRHHPGGAPFCVYATDFFTEYDPESGAAGRQ